MQRRVIFRPNQKISFNDLNNAQLFAQQSFDALVANAVSSLRYFSGFAPSKTGQAEITLAPGHYWAGGPVFVRSSPTVFNLLVGGQWLPVITKRIVAIVAWGTEEEVDLQERSFKVNDQGGTIPQSVAMESLRLGNLGLVAGVEGPDPQKPILDAGVIPVAWVTCSNTGIIDGSIEVAEAYRLPSVESLYQRLNEFQTWRALIGQIVDTLQSEIAKIQAAMPPDYGDVILKILQEIENLKARLTVPNGTTPAAQSFVDRFMSLRDTDEDAVGYAARVEAGLRFPGGDLVQEALALNNPNDPKVRKVGNLLLPAWSSETKRISIDNPDGQLSISQYPSQETVRVQKMLSRTVTTYQQTGTYRRGDTDYSTLKTMFTGRFDLTKDEYDRFAAQIRAIDASGSRTGVFTFKRDGGETYTVNVGATYNNETWQQVQVSQKGTVEEPYWEYVTKAATFTGSQVAQTFWVATNGWLTSVGIQFGQVASSGNVNVLIAEVEGGKPLPNRIIGRGVINVADLVTTAPVKCTLEQPIYTKGGKRYAVILVTTGNHFVRVSSGNKYAYGDAFQLNDTAEWVAVQNSGDLCMSLHYARFSETRTEVLMESLQRTGGMSAIKITAAQFEPEGTKLTFETQRAGKWYQISEGEYDALTTNPALVSLRMVFTGSLDLMPGIDMDQTEVEISKTEDELVHFSKAHALDAATTSVQVIYEVEGWDEGDHDLDCQLIISGTPENPDSSSVKLDPEDSTRARISFVFSPASTSSYAVKTIVTTADLTKQCVVTRREDHAL